MKNLALLACAVIFGSSLYMIHLQTQQFDEQIGQQITVNIPAALNTHQPTSMQKVLGVFTAAPSIALASTTSVVRVSSDTGSATAKMVCPLQPQTANGATATITPTTAVVTSPTSGTANTLSGQVSGQPPCLRLCQPPINGTTPPSVGATATTIISHSSGTEPATSTASNTSAVNTDPKICLPPPCIVQNNAQSNTTTSLTPPAPPTSATAISAVAPGTVSSPAQPQIPPTASKLCVLPVPVQSGASPANNKEPVSGLPSTPTLIVPTTSTAVTGSEPPITSAIFSDGTLVKGSDHTVYLVFGNKKYGIPSVSVFNRLGLSFKDVQQIPDTTVNDLPTAGIQQ